MVKSSPSSISAGGLLLSSAGNVGKSLSVIFSGLLSVKKMVGVVG